jgi:hypothetical protein
MNDNSIKNEEKLTAASGIINGLILSLIIWVFAILLVGCSSGSNNDYHVPGGVDAKINNPPIAYAGEDQTVAVTESALLNGSNSYDPDENYPLTYEWKVVSMPEGSLATTSEAASINGSDASQFSIKADLNGDYVIQLVVTDSLGLSSDPAFVTVSTNNSAPVANAGSDQTAYRNDLVTLDGSGSSDVDGDSLTYSWSLITVPNGSSASLSDPAGVHPTFTVDVSGTYAAQLIVNDGTLDSAPDTVVINWENSAPVANAGSDQTAYRNDLVTLDGSGSSDADGDSLTYSWSLITVPNGSSASLSDPAGVHPTFTVDVSGTYVAQLIVNDGTFDSAPKTVTIDSLNSPPVADAGQDQSFSTTPVTIQLNGRQSYDPDGDPLNYLWSIVSMPPESSTNLSDNAISTPTFVADSPGTYIVQLIVSDDMGLSSNPDKVIITSGNVRPVAKAGFNQVVLVGEDVLLDGSGSYDANNDPLTYSWNMTSKPKNSSTELINPTSVNPTYFADTQGEFVISLVVGDGTLDSNASSVTILAIDVGNLDDFIRALIEAVRAINNLEPSDFNNENNRNALTSKIITSVLPNYLKGSFDQNMLDKLRDDIAGKTDGCASHDFQDVDQNDWIMNCYAQGVVYQHLERAIALLDAILKAQ